MEEDTLMCVEYSIRANTLGTVTEHVHTCTTGVLHGVVALSLHAHVMVPSTSAYLIC